MITLTRSEPTHDVTTSWYIEGLVSPIGQLQRISVPSGRLQIGRRSDINLSLPHGSVSKLHAEIIASDVALFVRDMGSTNGTFVNGKRITEDTPIGEADVVQFADFEFIVGRAQDEQPIRTMVSSPTEWQNQLAQFHSLMTDRSVVPFFQPIVQFVDAKPVGYEVLARSSLAGLTNPKEMYTTAERLSQASRLSVMCREIGIEIAKSLSIPGLVFLNTHPSEQPQAGLLESLAKLRSIAPDVQIVLELHETAVTNSREISEFRAALRDLQIQLAFDDFGSGQSRLLELSEVAPDFLKFDMSLIRDIHLASQRQQLVSGLVQIAKDLGINPLAEGIESSAEADVCRQIGFTHAQGYFYGKPVAAKSLS